MNESGIVNIIGNVGFPIAVSIYLLIRVEGKLEVLTSAINNLSSKLGGGSITPIAPSEKKSA